MGLLLEQYEKEALHDATSVDNDKNCHVGWKVHCFVTWKRQLMFQNTTQLRDLSKQRSCASSKTYTTVMSNMKIPEITDADRKVWTADKQYNVNKSKQEHHISQRAWQS